MQNFNEKDLVHKLDKILKKEFGTNLSFREFSAGYGIADLVFAADFSFRKNSVKRNPLTSFNSLKFLFTLEKDKSYKLGDFISMFPQFSTSEIKNQIRALTNNAYLIKSNDIYTKSITEENLNPIKRIVAIEVKLNDHKGGLVQARRYQYFADDSYLAILKEAEKNIDVDEFNKHNIGLILFDTKTNTIEIKHPNKTNCKFETSVSLFAKEMMLNQFMRFSS